jgi:hypothetical protein
MCAPSTDQLSAQLEQQQQPVVLGPNHGHVGLLHFIVHSVEFDAPEYSKPLESFFLLK